MFKKIMKKLSGEKSLEDLPTTKNHFEMLGFGGSEKEIMDGFGFALKNPTKVSKVQIKKDYGLQDIPKAKEVVYLECDKYDYGVKLIIITEKGSIITAVPNFTGKSKYPLLVKNVHPAGGFEAELEGLIPSKVGGAEGMLVTVSVPNLITNNYYKLKQHDTLNLHISGLIQVANISKFKSKKTKTGIEMGRMGYLFPRQPSNPQSPYFAVLGEIKNFKRIKNKNTGVNLIWIKVDTRATDIELVGNEKYIHGTPEIGKKISAYVWLQGTIL